MGKNNKKCNWKYCREEATRIVKRKFSMVQLCDKHADIVLARISKRQKSIMEKSLDPKPKEECET